MGPPRVFAATRQSGSPPRRLQARARAGSITVEGAILLPLLMTLALLTVDFGRLAHSFIAVSNAAREGAARGAFTGVTPGSKPLWDAAIEQAARDELAGNGWYEEDVAAVVVAEPTLHNDGPGQRRVSVEVTYPFRTLINWPFLPGYNDPINLRRVATMRLVR